ncbi:hypothetical protein [Tautonia plasticadhaerens]|uniref:Uncharacterized protein n=1 Tax=Tautonia plasticadhaerens TaxID=2527974 RepID=A0A518GUJ8_9BACT|nr:hypothetical protein [Tautonia plasticadhaerens]QDV32269.1 hypothetical protein ElP_00920 [Tautonia plasticadhaerens]
MRIGTSRPNRGRRGSAALRMAAPALGLATALGAALGAGRAALAQVPPRPPTSAPGLDPSRAAPGLQGSGRSGEAPGLDTLDRPAPSATEPGAESSDRYRFIEAYGPPEAPGQDIGSYRVAFLETQDQSVEVAGAAPERARIAARVVYTARPAVVGGLENRQVSALVRQYETVQISRDDQDDSQPLGPAGLAGQTLWVQDQGGPAPTILTLPGSPSLTQAQFGFAAYDSVYVPELSGVLSPLHVGVGSSWALPKEAAEALAGDVIRNGTLEATFEDLLPPGEGQTDSRAIIRVSGRLELVNSQSAINARLEFAFEDPAPAADDPSRPVATLDPTLVDVKGAVVRLLMAQRNVIEIPDADGRVMTRASQLRELNLERRLDLTGVTVPSLPVPPPTPTPENSWVSYHDPDNLFLFKHPQEFRPSPIQPMGGSTLNLSRNTLGGVPDDLTLVFFPRGEQPPEIRPEAFSQRIAETWQSVPSPGVTLGRGAEGFLPEADWPGTRVYRVELPITYRPSAYSLDEIGQAYFSAYLAQFSNGAVLELEAMTESAPAPFRAEVEAILRTVRVDPAPPRGSSPRPTPSPSATPPPAASTPAASPDASSIPPPDPNAIPDPGPGADPGAGPGPEPDLPPPDPGTGTDPDPGADRPSRPPPPPFE